VSIELTDISKSFGSFVALRHVTLTVPDGELVALLGPSGSGKTTLLRIIAGLEQPDAGSGAIRFHDEDVAGHPVGDRRVGFVFQHYALFRHMSVFENVAFGLKVRPRAARPSTSEIRARVARLLRLVQLDGFAGRYPHQLSGGQRQRVALARALAIEPRVLLLDEPFGALDAKVRKELRRWLRQLHEEIHVTSVFVTHDQEEALELADRVIVLDKGRVQQVGTPEDVYERPQTAFVQSFIGEALSVPVTIQAGAVHFAGRKLDLDPQGTSDGAASLFIRPYDIAIVSDSAAALNGVVKHVHGFGPARRVEIALQEGGREHFIELNVPRQDAIAVGQRIGLAPRAYRLFASPAG